MPIMYARFAEGLPYHITWFPTRMNDTIHPVDALDSTGSGYVLLDFSIAPLGDTANKYLDTLQMDYGFIISLAPVLRNMNFDMDADTPPSTDWDFILYPNPASDRLSAVFPDQVARDITIYDLSGRLVYQRNRAQGPVITIPLDRFSSGTYCVRVSAGDDAKHKLFIVQ
jgi:hypothetical protein